MRSCSEACCPEEAQTVHTAAVAGHEWKASFLAVILHYQMYLSYSLWQGWCWKAKTCWIAFVWMSYSCSTLWSWFFCSWIDLEHLMMVQKWLSADSSCWFRALLCVPLPNLSASPLGSLSARSDCDHRFCGHQLCHAGCRVELPMGWWLGKFCGTCTAAKPGIVAWNSRVFSQKSCHCVLMYAAVLEYLYEGCLALKTGNGNRVYVNMCFSKCYAGECAVV